MANQPNLPSHGQIVGQSEDQARRLDRYMRGWIAQHSSRSKNTGATYAGAIRRVLPDVLASGGLSQIDASQAAILMERWSGRMGTATLNVTLAALSSLWRDAQEEGILTAPFPWRKVKRKQPRSVVHERVLTEHEVAILVNNADPGPKRVFAQFLFQSGARVSEAVAVRWTDIAEQKDGSAYVTLFGKGSKSRTIRIKPWLWRVMQDQCARNHEYLWPSKSGKKSMSRVTGYRIIHRAAIRGRLIEEGDERVISPHVLRHSHASISLEHGANILQIQENLGHASLTTTQKYLHLAPGKRSEDFLPDL